MLPSIARIIGIISFNRKLEGFTHLNKILRVKDRHTAVLFECKGGIMQEELERKTVALVFKATRFTADALG